MYSQTGRSFFSEIESMFNIKTQQNSTSELNFSKQDSMSISIDYNLGKINLGRD